MTVRGHALSFILLASFLLLFGCDGKKSETIREAVEANDPKLCDKLDEGASRESCYEEVAKDLKDPKACLGSSNPNECISEYAAQDRSVKACDMIADQVGKYACIARVTGDSTGRSIDIMLAEWRNKRTVEACRNSCSATTKPCFSACASKYPGPAPDPLSSAVTDASRCYDSCRWEIYDCQDKCTESQADKE